MKEITITTQFTAYNAVNELPTDIQELMEQAIAVRKKAYAPYSKFRVGAAILLDNGQIVLGSNQENAAYPSGLCAERVAIFQAGAIYPEAKILKMAITAASDTNKTQVPSLLAVLADNQLPNMKQNKTALLKYILWENQVTYINQSP